MVDIILRGGKVYDGGELREFDLAVQGQSIEAWLSPGAWQAELEIDVSDKWILPGLVDAHFHCREPAHPEKEDFFTGSQAAAAGGVTTFFEMPLSDPAVYNGEILNARREMGEASCVVDFALYAVPGTLDVSDISSAVDSGAIGFKIFTTAGPRQDTSRSRGIFVADDQSLLSALNLVARTGLICSVHAEDQRMLDAISEEMQLDDTGETRPQDHMLHRPPVVEDYASARLLALAKHTGAKVHLAHMSSGFSALLLAAARKAGVDVSGETCHHYLAFESTVMEEYGPFAKVLPPIRGGDDRQILRQSVASGDIDILVSDHSPHSVESKQAGSADIRLAAPGSPGVEMLGRYFLDQVVTGALPLRQVLDALTINPCRRFGIDRRKGHLRPSADADFIVFDPNGEFTVDQKHLFTKSKESAVVWHGRKYAGNLETTWVRGERVYENGSIVGRKGHGRMVRPE